jgi:hypothetical protein
MLALFMRDLRDDAIFDFLPLLKSLPGGRCSI